jgi:2-aminoadipate transaminase
VYPKLLQAKQAADLHSPGFNQRMVAEVMKAVFWTATCPPSAPCTKSKRDAMLAALKRDMPADFTWNSCRLVACSCGLACPKA